MTSIVYLYGAAATRHLCIKQNTNWSGIRLRDLLNSSARYLYSHAKYLYSRKCIVIINANKGRVADSRIKPLKQRNLVFERGPEFRVGFFLPPVDFSNDCIMVVQNLKKNWKS